MDRVPESTATAVTAVVVDSVIDLVPLSAAESITAIEEASVIEVVPVSVLELLLARTLDSVTDNVPISGLADIVDVEALAVPVHTPSTLPSKYIPIVEDFSNITPSK
jgi:hypothetical protein